MARPIGVKLHRTQENIISSLVDNDFIELPGSKQKIWGKKDLFCSFDHKRESYS